MVTRKCFVSVRAALQTWLLVTAAVLGGLAGCGPGVGGTGIGDIVDPLVVFGASTASVCASELAPVLACPVPGGAGAPVPGTAPVYLSDTTDGRRVVVRMEGNLIEANAPCARIQFRGQWGTIAGQAARFYGSTGQDASATPATLRAVVRGNGLELTVVDALGRVLLGPVLVTVRPAPVVAGDCG